MSSKKLDSIKKIRKQWTMVFKHIISGFFYPIIIIVFFNLGLILNLPPIIKYEPVINIIHYLSVKIIYEMPPDYFIGALTIFILFFSFAQFSYSRQSLPANLIRKHILHHTYTLMFIGCQLSFSTIIGFFLFDHTEEIYTLNYIFIFIILITSVIISIIYFYWLSKSVTAEGMFDLIQKKLDFEEIKRIEVENNVSYKNFTKLIESDKNDIKYTLFDYFGFVTEEHTLIDTDQTGIIADIDLEKLNIILKPYIEIINEVILDIKIGQRIPVYDPYPEMKPRTTLMRINLKIANHGTKNNDLRNEINKGSLKEKIIDCYKIKQDSFLFESNNENLQDLLLFYFFAVRSEQGESKKMIEQFSSFILNKIKSLDSNSKIKLTEKLFLQMIEMFRYQLLYEDFTNAQYNVTIRFIYSLRNVAAEGSSYNIMSNLLSVLYILFRKYIYSEQSSYDRVNSIILNFREVSFSTLVYSGKYDSKIGFLRNYKTFYLPLIRDSVNQASIAFYTLIIYSLSNEKIGYRLLTNNAQHLINYLSPLEHWKPVDALQFGNTVHYKEEKKKIIMSHGQNIIHLSVLLYKYIEDEKLPIHYLKNIAFPLADNSCTIEKYYSKPEEYLDEYFYSYDFQEVTGSFLQEEFEINKIHEAGTYSPILYSFSRYWLVYSIYRNSNGNSFIPSTVTKFSSMNKSLLENQLRVTNNISRIDLSKYLNISLNKTRELLHNYKTHINNLLNMFENNAIS